MARGRNRSGLLDELQGLDLAGLDGIVADLDLVLDNVAVGDALGSDATDADALFAL